MKKSTKKKIIAAAVIIAAIIIACIAYLGDCYKAHRAAPAFMYGNYSSEYIEPDREDGLIIIEPENPVAGVIFYPGGKVEADAYIPLMTALYSKDILCIIPEMPFNLAVFDKNAADGITEQFPEIENWYISGHSLGGSMAASYAAKNADSFDGIILLGAYSTADLSQTVLEALSIFGSEDNILNKEKYEANKSNLPDGFTEFIIDGGCHAYFGVYGAQDGDGTPEITNEEQINITAEQIAQFIKN